MGPCYYKRLKTCSRDTGIEIKLNINSNQSFRFFANFREIEKMVLRGISNKKVEARENFSVQIKEMKKKLTQFRPARPI